MTEPTTLFTTVISVASDSLLSPVPSLFKMEPELDNDQLQATILGLCSVLKSRSPDHFQAVLYAMMRR